MLVYRIVKLKVRANDLSGTGAFLNGGRWNNKGTYMLYTSENSSLAYLENLVYFDKATIPPQLYISEIAVSDIAPIYTPRDSIYPADWKKPGLTDNKTLGDTWMKEAEFLGIKVRSAVNQFEYNLLLNPLYPAFSSLVKVQTVTRIDVDGRLIGV